MIAGVLLAAGAGGRFGGDKLLAPLPDGTPLGVRAARTLRMGVDHAVAVVRPGDDALASLLSAEGLDVAFCPAAAEGMGSSLAFGVASRPDADGWLVALADMPYLRPATVAEVARRLRAGALVAAPSHRGRRGHPVGFGRTLYGELIGLGGDEGARRLLACHAAQVETFDVDDPGIFLDVDTLDDIRESPDP